MGEPIIRSGQPVVIGVDVGTTAAKVTAFDVDPSSSAQRTSRRISASREYPLEQPQPGWQVQNPQTMMVATLDALAEVTGQLAGRPVLAIGLSTAMHGLIGLGPNCAPVTDLVTWADARAVEQAASLRARGVARPGRSGTPTHAMAPIAKLRWFTEQQPATASQVRWWVGLKDLLIWTLTGELATELSSASGTGLLNLRTRAWDLELIAEAGIRPDQLPPILPTTAQFPLVPALSEVLKLPVGLPVVLGAGDGPLANLGVGALGPGVGALSVGTSGAVRVLGPTPLTGPDVGLFSYALTDDNWAIGGAISNGGLVARWAAETLLAQGSTKAPTPEEFLTLAGEASPGSDGLVFIPYLMGERSPLWDPHPAGSYLGLRRHHGPAHLARAAIEGVAISLAAVVEQVDRQQQIEVLRATGGVFRSALWRDIIAACVDRPLLVVNAAEGCGLGAAALALSALGLADSLSDPVRLLTPRTPERAPYLAPPEQVATYRALRASIPELIQSLVPVAQAFAPRTD